MYEIIRENARHEDKQRATGSDRVKIDNDGMQGEICAPALPTWTVPIWKSVQSQASECKRYVCTDTSVPTTTAAKTPTGTRDGTEKT